MKDKLVGMAMLVVMVLFLVAFSAQGADWKGVEQVMGRSGSAQGDMFKITFPRSDLNVKIGEVKVEPGLALTSWVGFKTMGKGAMMMGDLVLLEKEVTPVMTRLIAEGLEVTALHNHLLKSTPVVMYLHIGGNGDPQKLAAAVRSALSLTATPMKPPAPAASAKTPEWGRVETVMGKAGQKKGNLLQFSFTRNEKVMEDGMEIAPFMGVASPINLQMVGDKAASTGDFVLLASEVNPVVKALLEHGIAVTAIHSHMLVESPRLFFLHFWGYDQPEKVATGLRAALDKMNLAK